MTCIVTLRFDDEAQAFFERQRQAHYPPDRNWIAAHLTLFHTLPDSQEVRQTLHDAARSQPRFSLRVTGLQPLGGGVAYKLESPAALALHSRLRAVFAASLTAQDGQPFRPHVVIQNKVPPASARALLTTLCADFQEFAVPSCGLDLWHYLGGPWKLAEQYSFAPAG